MSQVKPSRVQMSKLGLQCFKIRDPERQGNAWPHTSLPGMVRVLWDGAKQEQTYSEVYLKRVKAQPKGNHETTR